MVSILSSYTLAQSNPNEDQGLKPYDTWQGGDLDSISVTSGGLSLHIPLVSFPQRGNLDLSFAVRFSNKQWYIKPARYSFTGTLISPAQWMPMPTTGVQIVSSTDWLLNTTYAIEPSDPNSPGQTLYDWSQSVSSPDGASHTFGDQIASFSGPLYPMRSLDASGLLRPDAQTVILPSGTRYTYSGVTGTQMTGPFALVRGGTQPNLITDANGNQISISSSGWTDTLGRFISGSASAAFTGTQAGVSTTDLSKCPAGTASASIWNVPGVATVNGGVRTFYFCYSMFSIYTNFDSNSSQGAQNYGPVSTSLLSAVVLPDLTIWTFTYDNFGDVLNVAFPTGGSLTYTYGVGPFNSSSGTGFSTWVMTRTVNANDGTGAHQWTYKYQGNFSTGQGTSIYPYGTKGVATITGPDGNDVVHTVGPGVSGSGCPGYVYQTQHYQGSAGSGTLLKTIQAQYTCTMGTPGGNLDGVTLNAMPTQITIIWPGGQSYKVVNSVDSTFNDANGQAVRLGSILQKDEYDYSNTLARSALTRYWWQDNSTYLNNNFIALPEWTTVYNGAAPQSTTLPACSSSSTPACISQVKYTYDEGTRAASGIGVPTHVAPPAGDTMRGNLTTLSRWLDTSNAFVSASSSYFDTGMKASTADPLGHATNFTYSTTFLGAYLTQTNLPDTQMPDTGAPVVHHVVSANYDLNTGLLTRFTDENGQNFTYSYDIMLRLTEGDHPDGGITKFFYPDPNTVERQRLITGSTYDDYKIKLDGLGRQYQTQRLTPDCGSYIKIDTTYDVLGRSKSISNPYCLTSETTYGITQMTYDALGRVTQTTKQDNSINTVKYNDTPGDTSGPAMVCTTTTDEAGKKRQNCTDAFGHLVKAVEPNPGAAATNATGWVAVAGNEQTSNSQPATSGSGAVNITGQEQTVQNCIGTRCFTIWDTGTVAITVNGYTKTYSYGKFDTPATVAWHLSCLFHNDASSPVDAPCPGSAGSSTAVSMTARATGASTNYSFTSSSATSDTSGNNFTQPSFFAAPASGALTGGQNASSTNDSGTVTVTINGTVYSTTFGSGDTSASIASRLATAITAGSWATASLSGSTINFTSKTPGTIGDYSLAASYTWNTSQFTNPSFTTSTSGSALSGAKDASAINNNPYVTTYQYNARGDMLCVHQKATDTAADIPCTGTAPPAVSAGWRQRFFTYDSFSRILTAMNPETNSTGSTKITYSYDNDGNLASKTEPAPNQAWGSAQTVTINYTYDALNRQLDTTYVGSSTQNSSHRYDYSTYLGQTMTNPIGREVAATAAGNAIEYFIGYDTMGHVSSTTQCNPGVTGCKTFTASYDKLGDVTGLAYPANNFTVTYGYDSAARLVSANDSNGVIYAQAPVFWSTGAMKEFTSPNFSNYKFHLELNNRLQPIEIWTGSSQGASALFDKQYQYNPTGQTHVNNGDIFTITNVKDATRTQTFTYDPLNRLLTAGDSGHWSNSYVYDPWGNLLQKNPGSPAGENLVKTSDNNNHLSGITYDAAGNEIADGVGGTFVYDAENRITTASGVNYTYDAGGRRIQKSNGTNYWYGPGGAVLAETDSAGSFTNYVFFAGQRLARNVNGDIKYYVTDHLHSTAIFADKSGAVLDDNDFYPWGGVVPGIGGTTSNNNIKFTGQYRDAESQLDYFGARYYANVNGRFMSPDWAAAPVSVPYAEFGDPQSLNLYSYTKNNPIVRIDPDGHFDDPFGVFSDGDTSFSNMQSRFGPVLWDVQGTYTTTTTTRTYADGTVTTTTTIDVQYTMTSWLGTFNGSYTSTQTTCNCTLQLMSRPLQAVENSKLPGFIKWFAGLFARHLMLDVTKVSGEELIEGWKDKATNELFVRTLTNPDEIKAEKGNRSTNVGRATSSFDVGALEQAAGSFQRVTYWLVFGANSNSAAHWLLDQAGLAGMFGPFGTPGWPHSAHQN